MAIVYRARDLVLDREVAVKVLHAHLAGQAESRDRLEREAQAVAKLRHENILEIYDYSGRTSDKAFIVTEFIHGTTLRAFMQTHASVLAKHPEIAELIVSEVARALDHAHKAGVIHRDVKPENVMIRNDGVIKLTDFGIAQMIDKERMTVTGQLLGSPAYMAPEHVEGGGIDFRTDVFAVGILLYQLATGKLPFRGKNPHEVLKRIGECTSTRRPTRSTRASAAIARARSSRARSRRTRPRATPTSAICVASWSRISPTPASTSRAPSSRACSCRPEELRRIARAAPRRRPHPRARSRAAWRRVAAAGALELWRRALEITPHFERDFYVAGRRRRAVSARIRTGRVRASSSASLVIGAGGSRSRCARRGHIARGTAAQLPTTMAPQRVVSLTTPPKSPSHLVSRRARFRSSAHTPHRAPRSGSCTSRVAPGGRRAGAGTPLRHFELVPTPKAVRVLVDDQLRGDFGPSLQSVELDERRAHHHLRQPVLLSRDDSDRAQHRAGAHLASSQVEAGDAHGRGRSRRGRHPHRRQPRRAQRSRGRRSARPALRWQARAAREGVGGRTSLRRA